jgi:hypothetical protein
MSVTTRATREGVVSGQYLAMAAGFRIMEQGGNSAGSRE